jgi:hypothetical protein
MKLTITEDSPALSCAELKAKGNSCFQLEDYGSACGLYSQAAAAAECESSRIACLNNLAFAYIKLGSMEKAETVCNQVLTAHPENAKALFRRAQARLSAGRCALALEDYSLLLQLEPANKEVQALANEAEARLLESFDAAFISEAALQSAQPSVTRVTEVVPASSDANDAAHHSETAQATCAVPALEPPARKVYSNGIHQVEAGAYMVEGWKPPSEHVTEVQQTMQYCVEAHSVAADLAAAGSISSSERDSVAALIQQLKSSSLADAATAAVPQQLAPDSWQSLAAEESKRVSEARQKLLLVKDSVQDVTCCDDKRSSSSSGSSSSKLAKHSKSSGQHAVKAADAEWEAMLAAEAALKSRADAALRSKTERAKQKRCRDKRAVHTSVAEDTWAAMQAGDVCKAK